MTRDLGLLCFIGLFAKIKPEERFDKRATLKSMESESRLRDLLPGASAGDEIIALRMVYRIALRFMESLARRKTNRV
jgi:hypothetical protein